ncbi:hypothetical protein SAMN05216456_1933 [Devosia crocina]|uniref:Helix-turn-helix n=1 Tax=Devosia crocina TaxID=429728 RepID=A0A1I7NF33_9HYPH|nr:hypothetical protein [Devosia crocina]SFV33250.1 hypothetical protein SAMN05216456_1933 [Devosia crocina]
MKLISYLKSEALDLDDFATQVGGVTASGVRKWLRDERVPRPDQMRRIFEVTGGQVTPNDFVLRPDEVSA